MRVRIVAIASLALALSGQGASSGEFTPGPSFLPEMVPCDTPYYPANTMCRKLDSAFAYTHDGYGWEAPAGLITDGASIPGWGRWLIGEPFEDQFAKAATLHDHYCREENNVRDWMSTHRMFYDALIDSGVGKDKSAVMYAAIIVGGPKWSTIVPGEECELVDGKICVRTIGIPKVDIGNPSEDYVEAKFDELPMEQLLRDLDRQITAGNLSISEVEALAFRTRLNLGYGLPSPLVVADE